VILSELEVIVGTMKSKDLVTIGQVLKPFGIKGEVRVRSLSDVPGRFERLSEVILETPSGEILSTSVHHVRADQNSYVIGFKAFSTPEQAASYRGAWIKVTRDDTASLPDGQYFEDDLIGMTVKTEDGESLGTLNDVLDVPSHAVFVVQGDRGEVLIPAAKELILSVDVPHRIMTVRLIDGMLEHFQTKGEHS
jgi:16S rRNA processing protein RimM